MTLPRQYIANDGLETRIKYYSRLVEYGKNALRQNEYRRCVQELEYLTSILQREKENDKGIQGKKKRISDIKV